MVDHELRDHAQSTAMRLAQERPEVTQRAVRGVNAGVVRDIVAFVFERRRAERQQPNSRNAEVRDVIEFIGQAADVSHAIAVTVVERADADFIDDRVLVP